jgi:cytoskeleton protein RodZ
MNMTSDNAANADNLIAPKQSTLNVGMALREARESMGLSVHDIADRIKFAPKQVEALEANDFSHLPQATFLRGFVRSYARVLQLDEEKLIAALPLAPSRQLDTKAPSVDVAFPSFLKLQRVNMLWLAGALGVVVLLGLFILLHDEEQVAKPTDVVVEPVPLPGPETASSAVADTAVLPATDESAKVAEPVKTVEPAKVVQPLKAPEPPKVIEPKKLPEPVKAVEPKKLPEPAKVVEPRKAPEPAKVVEPKKTPEPAKVIEPKKTPEPAKVKVSVAPVPDAKSDVSLEALMRRPLHFVFGDAMWVEVLDARGAVLLSRNVTRGSEKWIGGPGRAPYDISISNPRKVKLYYKGTPIDLSAYPAAETAHLKVK